MQILLRTPQQLPRHVGASNPPPTIKKEQFSWWPACFPNQNAWNEKQKKENQNDGAGSKEWKPNFKARKRLDKQQSFLNEIIWHVKFFILLILWTLRFLDYIVFFLFWKRFSRKKYIVYFKMIIFEIFEVICILAIILFFQKKNKTNFHLYLLKKEWSLIFGQEKTKDPPTNYFFFRPIFSYMFPGTAQDTPRPRRTK